GRRRRPRRVPGPDRPRSRRSNLPHPGRRDDAQPEPGGVRAAVRGGRPGGGPQATKPRRRAAPAGAGRRREETVGVTGGRLAYQSAPSPSPPLGVNAAFQVVSEIAFATVRTLPSARHTFTTGR